MNYATVELGFISSYLCFKIDPAHYNIWCLKASTIYYVLVGWLYWECTSIQRYFSHIATWKQEITNRCKLERRGQESNLLCFKLTDKSMSPFQTVFILFFFSFINDSYHFCWDINFLTEPITDTLFAIVITIKFYKRLIFIYSLMKLFVYVWLSYI